MDYVYTTLYFNIYIWRSVIHYHIYMQAIWEELQDVVHAVDAMVTKTPEEMGKWYILLNQ